MTFIIYDSKTLYDFLNIILVFTYLHLKLKSLQAYDQAKFFIILK